MFSTDFSVKIGIKGVLSNVGPWTDHDFANLLIVCVCVCVCLCVCVCVSVRVRACVCVYLTPFSTAFQLYRGAQCTYPCFHGVLLSSTSYNILSSH